MHGRWQLLFLLGFTLVGIGGIVVIKLAQFEAATGTGDSSGNFALSPDLGRRPPENQWAIATTGKWTPTLYAYGTVGEFRETAIVAGFPVRVVGTDVELGQYVSVDQQLARVEAAYLQELFAHLNTAHDGLTVATAESNRVQELKQQGLVTAEKVVAADVARLQAERNQEDAWQELRQALVSLGQDPQRETLIQELSSNTIAALTLKLSVVRAPFDGIVTQRGAMPGVTLKADTVLFSVEDVSHAYLDVGIVPELISQWKQGFAAVDLLGKQIAVKRSASVARLDPATGLMMVRFRFDLAEPMQLEGARLRVTLRGAERSVTWVPATAVASRDGNSWCLVADESGNPIPVRVQAGTVEDRRIPIFQGVSAGQRVLAEDAYEYLYRDLKELLRFAD